MLPTVESQTTASQLIEPSQLLEIINGDIDAADLAIAQLLPKLDPSYNRALGINLSLLNERLLSGEYPPEDRRELFITNINPETGAYDSIVCIAPGEYGLELHSTDITLHESAQIPGVIWDKLLPESIGHLGIASAATADLWNRFGESILNTLTVRAGGEEINKQVECIGIAVEGIRRGDELAAYTLSDLDAISQHLKPPEQRVTALTHDDSLMTILETIRDANGVGIVYPTYDRKIASMVVRHHIHNLAAPVSSVKTEGYLLFRFFEKLVLDARDKATGINDFVSKAKEKFETGPLVEGGQKVTRAGKSHETVMGYISGIREALHGEMGQYLEMSPTLLEATVGKILAQIGVQMEQVGGVVEVQQEGYSDIESRINLEDILLLIQEAGLRNPIKYRKPDQVDTGLDVKIKISQGSLNFGENIGGWPVEIDVTQDDAGQPNTQNLKYHPNYIDMSDYIVMEISDNGIGMSPDDLKIAFQDGGRVEANDNHAEGSGTGTQMYARIIRDHGGRMFVHSVAGHGTNMFFAFPRM